MLVRWIHELHWWLYHDPNAPGVVQAFAAVVTIVLTAALAGISYWYAHLTNTLAKVSQEQLQLSQKQFQASLIPRLCLAVYPSTDNPQRICWSFKNLGATDLLIQQAEIRWNAAGKAWSYPLSQYPGGVFAAGDKLSNTNSNTIVIPTEYWPFSTEPPRHHNLHKDVHELLTISITVSDIVGLVKFTFEFTPGKGQKVTVT